MSCKWVDVCPLRKLERENKISEKWKEECCNTNKNWKECERYKKSKEGEITPNNMMPDGSIKEF